MKSETQKIQLAVGKGVSERRLKGSHREAIPESHRAACNQVANLMKV